MTHCVEEYERHLIIGSRNDSGFQILLHHVQNGGQVAPSHWPIPLHVSISLVLPLHRGTGQVDNDSLALTTG